MLMVRVHKQTHVVEHIHVHTHVQAYKHTSLHIASLFIITCTCTHVLTLLLFVFHVGFIKKCIQLYETTVVRHGLMLVGPTMSGKTKVSGILLYLRVSWGSNLPPFFKNEQLINLHVPIGTILCGISFYCTFSFVNHIHTQNML